MADIKVYPVRAGMNLAHPVGGVLPDEGGLWPEDQFTYRRLRDGDVTRDNPAPAELKVEPPSKRS